MTQKTLIIKGVVHVPSEDPYGSHYQDIEPGFYIAQGSNYVGSLALISLRENGVHKINLFFDDAEKETLKDNMTARDGFYNHTPANQMTVSVEDIMRITSSVLNPSSTKDLL